MNPWEGCIMGNREPHMRAEDMLGRTIMFPLPSERKLPLCVYEPQAPLFSNEPRYSVPVYVDLIPRELGVGLVHRFKPEHGMLARSTAKRKPAVHCNDIDGLVRELQRLDARNVSRDKVFEGKLVNALARVTAFPDIPHLRELYPNAAFVLNLIAVEFTL